MTTQTTPTPAQQIQAKILSVFAALIAAVDSWKPTTNLTNIISDVATVGETIDEIDPQVLPTTIGAELAKFPAEVSALETGQLAIVGSIPASFDGVADDILLFGVRAYKNGAPPTGSPAEQVKALNGY